MLCLNLKLHSFNFAPNIVDCNDTIRVSITTLPDQQKDCRTFDVKSMNMTIVPFTIKFNERTEKILIVFRKKTFFSNGPIIASAIIKTCDIGIYKENATQGHKKVSIYMPTQHQSEKENTNEKKARKVIGSMEINMSIKEDFSIKTYGISKDNIEQRTLRKKLNNFNSFKTKENHYIFN